MAQMNITVPVTLPEEPYKTETTKGTTFDITYSGPRFVLMQIDKDDHQVREAGRGDKADDKEVDEKGYEQDEYNYLLVDAMESADAAFRCAYVTHEYTHADVADYSEELTDADGTKFTWEHAYEGTTGMLGHIYWGESLLYNVGSQEWSGPTFRTHVNSKQSVIDSCKDQAEIIDKALADSSQTISDADRTTLTNHSTWLKSVETKYDGIDHWKIPFPEAPIPYFELPTD